MNSKTTSLAMLNQVHRFPGPYGVKVIGENSAEFVARVVQAVVLVLGPKCLPCVTTRQSAQGRHQSVNLKVQVQDAEQVLRIYAMLKDLPGLRFLL